MGDTLEDAVEQANKLDYAIIEIKADVVVTSSIVITSNVAIIGSDGMHTISNCYIQVKNGANLTIGDGVVTNAVTFLGSIHIIDGSIYVNDGTTISNTEAGGTAIEVDKGNVVVFGGTVSVHGDYCTAIDVKAGNIAVHGGTISANMDIGHGCYAISLGDWVSGVSGTVMITGGNVLANSVFGDNFAISLQSGGLATYLVGTCVGDFETFGTGIIVEVESLDIPSSYGGTTNDLTRMTGSTLSLVKWDTSGEIPVINFNNGPLTSRFK